MSYYYSRNIKLPFEKAIEAVTNALKAEGFGVLTQIDVKATLKQKLDVDFRNYIILGACNPEFAYKALQAEGQVGTMLPCNVVIQESEAGVEIAAVDPVASMQAIDNPKLSEIAGEIQQRLRRVVNSL